MTYDVIGLPVILAQQETQAEVEEHPAAEEHNPILPEADELIFGTLAFVLVFWVLAKFAFPRINQGLEARTEKIRGDLERAEEARQDAEGLLQRYEEQLRDARQEAGRVIEEARRTAESMRKDMMARAEEEARAVVSRAQEEVRAERDRAFQDLRRQVGELSVELAARVVGESLDTERQLRLVDSYIDEVGGMSPPAEGNGSATGGEEGDGP